MRFIFSVFVALIQVPAFAAPLYCGGIMTTGKTIVVVVDREKRKINLQEQVIVGVPPYPFKTVKEWQIIADDSDRSAIDVEGRSTDSSTNKMSGIEVRVVRGAARPIYTGGVVFHPVSNRIELPSNAIIALTCQFGK